MITETQFEIIIGKGIGRIKSILSKQGWREFKAYQLHAKRKQLTTICKVLDIYYGCYGIDGKIQEEAYEEMFPRRKL